MLNLVTSIIPDIVLMLLFGEPSPKLSIIDIDTLIYNDFPSCYPVSPRVCLASSLK